jgi:hypothetical protein
MAASTDTNTGTAGERGPTMGTTTTLTGDFSTDRAAWVAAGRPADHPYMTAPLAAWGISEAQGMVAPLTIELTAGQAAYMAANAAAMRAQSAANVRAMIAVGS